MAGYLIQHKGDSGWPFWTDTPNLLPLIETVTQGSKVITIQVDSDEKDAVLWGLANYQK